MGAGVTDLSALAGLHARLLLHARDCERLAERNPDHAERETAEAAALAAVLGPLGVHVPDPRQLALWSDGR